MQHDFSKLKKRHPCLLQPKGWVLSTFAPGLHNCLDLVVIFVFFEGFVKLFGG